MKFDNFLKKIAKYTVYFACLCSTCFAMKPPYLSEECWNSYIKTWCPTRQSIEKDSDIHESMAYRVALAFKRDVPTSLGHSNIASFSISIKCANVWHHSLLPFIVSSCDVPVVNDSTAFYWQKNGPDFPVVSVSQLFQGSPSYMITTADETLAFLDRIIQAQKEKKYFEEDWHLELAAGLVQKRVASGSYLSYLIKPVGTESGSENDVLRSVLHCEQVVFDKIMTDDKFVDIFVSKLKPFLQTEITDIDFNIVTYNDMCPKCFSTCKHRKADFLNRVNKGLERLGYSKEPVAINKFRILISSQAEYKIPETGYITRQTTDSSLCSNENIFQFKNQEILASLLKISGIEESRAKKCKEIDELFKQIETASGIKAQSKTSIMDLSYPEKMDAIRKSLAQSKKDKELPADCISGSGLYTTIQSENTHLAKVRDFVNNALAAITEKLGELSKIGYF